MAPIGDTTDLDATDAAATAGDINRNDHDRARTRKLASRSANVHKRRRLVLWIVLGAIVAGAAAFLVYRLYFSPDPIILPTPTATAQAASPHCTAGRGH